MGSIVYIQSFQADNRERAMDAFLEAAIAEAKKGLAEGGIPIGSVLVVDGHIVGRGHNERCKRAAPCFTPKWIAWKMPAD
jgi:hypothetical protein